MRCIAGFTLASALALAPATAFGQSGGAAAPAKPAEAAAPPDEPPAADAAPSKAAPTPQQPKAPSADPAGSDEPKIDDAQAGSQAIDAAPAQPAPPAAAPVPSSPAPSSPAAAAAAPSVASGSTPPPAPPLDSAAASDDGSDGQARYPGYVTGGVITLLAGAGLAVGGVVAAAGENEQTSIGLLALATTAAGVGVPLVMLGATDERPVDFPRAMAGVVVATPGAIGLGLGGTSLAAQLASDDRKDENLILPIGGMIAGGAALVVGIVVWATGAGHADDADGGVQASFELTPTGAQLRGRF
jgi:hypothetical protein